MVLKTLNIFCFCRGEDDDDNSVHSAVSVVVIIEMK
jgi:hypothetical protein